jgi:hypothetical protein
MAALITFITGLGLSTAAGLNAYLPLLTIGIFGRLGWIDLSGPFELLQHPVTLVIVAILAVADFVGDKVPAVDSVLHAVGMVIGPIAGAILALAAAGGTESINPILTAAAGIIAAGATQATRAAARPVFTAATAGTANPVVSLAEDGASLAITLLAIFVPVLALILLIIMGIVLFRFFRRSASVWTKKESVNGRR